MDLQNNIYADLLQYDYHGSDRPKMPMAQRAKIFLPFAALKGFEEAIEERIGFSIMESTPKYRKYDREENSSEKE